MNTFLFFSSLIAFARAGTVAVAPAAAVVGNAAPIATHQPAPIVKTHHVAQPIFKNVPTYGTQAITGPVRTHQTVHQPIVHETRTHTVQAVSQAVATPVHAVAEVPVAAYAAAPVAHAAAPVFHSAYAPAPVAHACYAAA